MSPARKRPDAPVHLSGTEWTVMNAVWTDPPVTARQVLDACVEETGWAYTTVKTLLDRLVDKGALAERKRANVSVYEPRITREDARRSALRRLVDRAFGGAMPSLVHHLVDVERLSAGERSELEAALEAARRVEPPNAAAPDRSSGRRRRPKR